MCHSYFDSFQLSECYDCYDRLIKVHGESEESLHGRGYASLQMGNNKAGKEDYRKALIYNDTCGNCYKNLLETLAIEDSLDKALMYVERLMSMDAEESEYYIMRARINQRKNKKYGIVSDYNKAISLSPTAKNYVVRADYYFGVNQISQASLDYDEAIKLDPDNPEYRNRRGRFYGELNEAELAKTDFEIALQADSMNPDYLSSYAMVLSISGQAEEAIYYYNRAIEVDSLSFQLIYNRGLAYYNLENMEKACHSYSMALSLAEGDEYMHQRETINKSIDELCDTTKISHYYHHGISQYNLDDFQKAIDYYDHGISKFPKSILLHYFRGNAYTRLLRYSEAGSDYLLALSFPGNVLEELGENPNMEKEVMDLYSRHLDAEMELALAKTMFFQKDYLTSLGSIKRSLGNMPEAGFDEDGLGQRLFAHYLQVMNYGALGRFEEAENTLNLMVEYAPMDPSNYLLLAQLYYVQTTEDYADFFHKCASNGVEEGIGGATIAWPPSGKKLSKQTKEKLIKSHMIVNRSIDLSSEFGEAYYFRAMIKNCIDEADVCSDLILAQERGMPDAIISSRHQCD